MSIESRNTLDKECIICQNSVTTVSDTPVCSTECLNDYAERELRSNDRYCTLCDMEYDRSSNYTRHALREHNVDLRVCTCDGCKDEFIPDNPQQSSYCSRDCFFDNNPMLGRTGEDHPVYGITGSDHPRWKGGGSPRNRRDAIEWRKKIYSRDDYTCQDCNSNRGGNLNAHHIERWSESPDKRYDIDNGVTLCQACHWRRHNESGDRIANAMRSKLSYFDLMEMEYHLSDGKIL